MKRWILILIGIVMVAVGATWAFSDAYGENIDAMAKDIAIYLVATKINDSIKDGLYDESYDRPLLRVERGEDGYIQYIEPDTMLINRLMLDFSMGVKEKYSVEDTYTTEVNLGVLAGSKILSQIPVYTKVRVLPLSLTKFQCHTEFETEGINQTHYNVYCTVESNVRVLAPFSNQTVKIERRYLVAEAVVVGKVPDSYVVVPEESILDAID